MSEDTDKTPLEYQVFRVSLKLSKVMKELHFLTEEVMNLQELTAKITEWDTIDWGKGKWVPDE